MNHLFSILSLKANSDLRTISKNGALLRTYYYDQAGQLTQEINHEAGIVSVYHYDAGGNLSYRNRGPYDPDHITELWKDKTYTYGDANWKDKLTAYNGKPITYDEIGNPLTYDGWAYTWEAGRQLKKQEKGTTSIEYTYDENGLRTQKKATENGKTTVYDYVWKGDRLIGLTIDASITTEYLYFFYDEDGKAAGFVHDNKDVYFYQLDAQGNVNALVKQDGSTEAEYTYDAWGNLLSSKGKMAKINPLTYRGYQYDQETGLYYLQSRYYNPEWGRFINADSIPNKEDVGGLNLFTYCLNNPIRFVDVGGERPQDSDMWGFAVVLVFVALYISSPLVGDFMLKNCTINKNGTVKIPLKGHEDFINSIMYLDPRIFGIDATSIDALIAAIPYFKLMAAWVGLIYLMKTNEFFSLSFPVITREIAFHVWGYMYFSHFNRFYDEWKKCWIIDINPNTDRFIENYIFGYKWPKFLEWLL